MFAIDHLNPTAPELQAAIARGLASGTLITAEAFLASVRAALPCPGCLITNHLASQPRRGLATVHSMDARAFGAEMNAGLFFGGAL